MTTAPLPSSPFPQTALLPPPAPRRLHAPWAPSMPCQAQTPQTPATCVAREPMAESPPSPPLAAAAPAMPRQCAPLAACPPLAPALLAPMTWAGAAPCVLLGPMEALPASPPPPALAIAQWATIARLAAAAPRPWRAPVGPLATAQALARQLALASALLDVRSLAMKVELWGWRSQRLPIHPHLTSNPPHPLPSSLLPRGLHLCHAVQLPRGALWQRARARQCRLLWRCLCWPLHPCWLHLHHRRHLSRRHVRRRSWAGHTRLQWPLRARGLLPQGQHQPHASALPCRHFGQRRGLSNGSVLWTLPQGLFLRGWQCEPHALPSWHLWRFRWPILPRLQRPLRRWLLLRRLLHLPAGSALPWRRVWRHAGAHQPPVQRRLHHWFLLPTCQHIPRSCALPGRLPGRCGQRQCHVRGPLPPRHLLRPCLCHCAAVPHGHLQPHLWRCHAQRLPALHAGAGVQQRRPQLQRVWQVDVWLQRLSVRPVPAGHILLRVAALHLHPRWALQGRQLQHWPRG